MADNIPFRTSLMGFNKEDVLKYIAHLQASLAENSGDREQTDRDIAGRDQEIIALKAENEQLNNRVRELERQLTDQERDSSAARQRAAQEKADLEKELNQKIEERTNQMSDSEEKLKTIQAQIGALMIDAQVYADKIVEQAENRVASLTNEYKETARSVSDDITRFTADLSDTTDALNQSLGSLKERLTSISDKLELATPNLFEDGKGFPKFAETYAQKHSVCPQSGEDANDGTTQFEINLDNLEISAVHNHKKNAETNT